MENLLEIKKLNAWYSENMPIIKELSMTIEKNTVIGLLGLNGAGKTTLINTLCGLHNGMKIDTALFNGKEISFRDNSFKKNRYVVFSEDNSLEYFTFDEYISYVGKTYSKNIDKAEIDRLSAAFNFDSYRSVLLKNLSLGNKRKAYLITAFALKPALLLLDEPVNGLDFQSTEALYHEISSYRKHGSILFSSHILESVTLTCDKVMILENGNISHIFTNSEITPENIRSVLNFEGDDSNV